MLNGLDLFSGYGGISLALKSYVKPILYCEKEDFAKGILVSRMQEEALPFAPIWNDVTTLDGSQFKGLVDIIFGGFPCQDISVAGLGVGLEGKRSGLFFEIIRLTKEINPAFVFLENVPAIRTRGLSEVLRAFTEIGYDCRWTCLSAESVGAPHKRERWFLLAHPHGAELRVEQGGSSRKDRQRKIESGNDGQKESMAHALRTGLERQWKSERVQAKHSSPDSSSDKTLPDLSNPDRSRLQTPGTELESAGLEQHGALHSQWWATEPNVGRVVNGTPNRVDRIKALGNGVVPLQVKTAFECLMGIN